LNYLLDERDDFDEQSEHIQELYQQLSNDFTKFKQQSSIIDDNFATNEKRLEQFKYLLKRLDEINNNLKELTRIQRLLTSKGHRIDFRIGGELNANLKNLEGQIQTEIERIERALQAENDFHHLDKEFESYLQISSEQLKSAQHQQDKGAAYQVRSER
jgi:predicted  nucleic acid-binding Zn-ribbon protein